MSRYIDAELLMQKLSRMIDYCQTDPKVSGLTALYQVGDAIMDCPTADVAPVDELIEAVKKIICENTYPSFDHNGKPVNVWKARDGYDALDALKEKYKGE